MGDGAAAWNTLKERFDGNTKEARRACREIFFSTSMKPGGDPVDFIASMHDLRLKLDDIWKKSSTTRTQMCCTGLTRQSSSS